jgi:bifunctional DNase/RNase
MKRRKLKILGLSYSQSQVGSYVVVLSDKSGIKIPVIIKPAEAQNIAMKLEGIKSPRPMTHDLIKSMTDMFSLKVIEVHIYALLEGVFYAKVFVSNGLDTIETDCSIGDALAMSLIHKCPIWANSDVVENAGIRVSDEEVEDAKEVVEDDDDDDEPLNIPKRSVSAEDLEHMMQNAIENEEYEIAAEIRDRIQKMKEENS